MMVLGVLFIIAGFVLVIVAQLGGWISVKPWVEANEKVLNAIFTASLAFATFALFWATRNLVDDAADSSARQLRAYVYLELEAKKYPTGNPDRMGVSIVATNGGKTWARNLTFRGARIPREPNVAYDPWDRVKWDELATQPMVLGPGQIFRLQLGDIPFSDLPAIVKGEMGFDYAVWARYEDAVSTSSATHQTQLSQRFGADKDGGTSFAFLPTHNCADDDCPK
jgi:hypothetical protein